MYFNTNPLTTLLNDTDRLHRISREHGTPLYLYLADRIRDNVTRVASAMEEHLPQWRLLYAMKANQNPVLPSLMRSVHQEIGVDCSSPGEISLAREAGFTRTDMIYTGNYESQEDLKYVMSAGITMNFDDITSYERCRNIGPPELVSFRVNPGEGKGAFPGITTAGKDVKFGVPRDKIITAYRQAKKDGVKRFGLHTMVGSGILEEDYFPWNCHRLLTIAGEIEEALDLKFEFIDLGGGFGIPYSEDDSSLDVHKIFDEVGQIVRESYGESPPAITYELGRYLIGDAGFVLARVTGTKENDRYFAGLDIGMSQLIRPALYGAYHRIVPLGDAARGTPRVTEITGQICENTDRLARNRELPELHAGDLVAIMDAGAYGFSLASQYNGRPLPAEVLVDGEKTHLIRERETLVDLSKNIVHPDL